MILVFVIPSLNPGGMERVMSEIINYFALNKDDELHLVMFGPSCAIPFYSLADKVSVHKPYYKYDDSKRMLYAIQMMKFIRQTVRKINPDAVLSFGEIWNSFVLLALYGLRYPVYVSDRCQPDKSFGKFQNFLRKLLYPRAAGIIAQTQKAKDIYLKQFKNDNIVVIGNPIRSIESCNAKRDNIVLSVGRLIDTKNFDQLIEIFSNINNSDWKLIIVGGDANKQNNSVKLQEQIDALGFQDRIILAGTQKDVDSFFLKSKIFAFTSSSEGFPNVIGEAMSAGLPVVAYDCVAGPSEMISDGENGFLIPLFDSEAFNEKLSLLMRDTLMLEEMGNHAIRSITEYSSAIICNKYYSFITEKCFYEKITVD